MCRVVSIELYLLEGVFCDRQNVFSTNKITKDYCDELTITDTSGHIGGMTACHLSRHCLPLILSLRNPAKAPYLLATCVPVPMVILNPPVSG